MSVALLDEWQRLYGLQDDDPLSQSVVELNERYSQLPVPSKYAVSGEASGGSHIVKIDWFAGLQAEMAEEQEAEYLIHVHALSQQVAIGDALASRLRVVTTVLSDMAAKFEFVDGKCRALQEACERLLDEQVKHADVADSLAAELAYFNDLDKIAKLFNEPGEEIVLNEYFLPFLSRTDECLTFIQNHINYKDAELYMMRFRQCMTRGLSLIKIYFANAVRTLQLDVQKAIKSEHVLVAEIEARCDKHGEYLSLLHDCYYVYFSTRQQLLAPVIVEHVTKVAANSENLISLARNGCAYMSQVCADEYRLFLLFFEPNFDEISELLDSLSSHLYDYLRTKIIQENNIDVLAELCTIIRDVGSAVVQDTPAPILERPAMKVMQDTQARLVFRAQTFIRSEIQNFKPTNDDYEQLDKVFPIVEKSLYIISKLHKSINPGIFQDLTQEILLLTLESLKSTSEKISSSKGKMDAQMFIIKHLLYLRDNLVQFNADFVQSDKSLDFTPLKQSVSLFMNNPSGVSLFNFLESGMPVVVEQTSDSKQEVDMELKRQCEQFILDATKIMVEALSSFLLKVSAFKIRESVRGVLRQQPFAQPDAVLQVYKSFLMCLKERMPLIVSKLTFYIQDKQTSTVLWKPIQTNILDSFRKFLDAIKMEYETEISAQIMSLEELDKQIVKQVTELMVERQK